MTPRKVVSCGCALLVFSFVSLVANATNQTLAHPQDPYEHYNRQIFDLNSKLDNHFLKPVAKAYRYMLPPVVRISVTNVFRNLDEPTIMADDLLQGDFVNFTADAWRFLINSTFGLFGLFDVAGHMNIPIPYHYNDFGLTMARWGITQSPYFIIPFLGPSTARDTFGIIVDYYGLSVYPWIDPRWTRYVLLSLYYVETRARYLDFQSILAYAALNPYLFQRNAYLQRRRYLIEQMEASIHEQYAHHESQWGFFLKPTHHWRDSRV